MRKEPKCPATVRLGTEKSSDPWDKFITCPLIQRRKLEHRILIVLCYMVVNEKKYVNVASLEFQQVLSKIISPNALLNISSAIMEIVYHTVQYDSHWSYSVIEHLKCGYTD